MHGSLQLIWEGKREAISPPPSVFQVSERYGNGTNRLLRGDNLAVMASLCPEYAGKFALIYLDPPFFTGHEFFPASHRSDLSTGDTAPSEAAFSDDWSHNPGLYLQWLLDRLTLARTLLSPTGCLYLHLSWHIAHAAKLVLDEVFGPERFQNEIIWCYREGINSKKRWNRKHDTLLFYSRGEQFSFHYDRVREPYSESHVRKYRQRDEKGAYRIMGRGISGSPLRSHRDITPDMETQFPDLTYRHYLGEGTLPVDYWHIDIENQSSYRRTGYPTQKPESLLERILLASSDPEELIGDFCCGSGTTLATAARLGRSWIGCDSGALAVHTTRKRLLETADGADFTVEHLADVPVNSSDFSADSFRVMQEADGWRVCLTEAASSVVDMWSVEVKEESSATAPFHTVWWSARTRRSPHIQNESPLYPQMRGLTRIRLIDAHGEASLFSL